MGGGSMSFIRKHFMIKPKLQLKYMALTAVVVILTGFVVRWILHAVLMASGGMENLSTGEWLALERGLDRSLYLIIGFIAVVLAVESIFFFHRMVGPLFVFERILKSLKEGDLTAKFTLRKGDEFKEVAAHLNEALSTLSAKIKKIKEIEVKLQEAASKLPMQDKKTFQEKLAELGKELESFKTQ